MLCKQYANRITDLLVDFNWHPVEVLGEALYTAWKDKKQVFLCGNGGSAGNAIHLANDFLYGIASDVTDPGLRVEALPANNAVMTCLANDIGYEEVFAEQVRVKGNPGDLLIVLSGSGNSENVVRALDAAKDCDMETCGILGYSGGQCLVRADIVIHFPIDDMQIAEDMQLIAGHMCMQYLHQEISSLRSDS